MQFCLFRYIYSALSCFFPIYPNCYIHIGLFSFSAASVFNKVSSVHLTTQSFSCLVGAICAIKT